MKPESGLCGATETMHNNSLLRAHINATAIAHWQSLVSVNAAKENRHDRGLDFVMVAIARRAWVICCAATLLPMSSEVHRSFHLGFGDGSGGPP